VERRFTKNDPNNPLALKKWQYGICIAIMTFSRVKEWSRGASLQ
jgi:hypothetical protein